MVPFSAPRAASGRPDVQVGGAGNRRDPRRSFRGTFSIGDRVGLFGEFDGYVPPKTNVPVFRAAFARSGNRDTTIVVFPRANHRFEESSRPMISDWVIGSRYLPEYYATMAAWLDRRVTRKR